MHDRLFGLRDCKRLAATLECAPSKVTDSLWDAYAKLALLSLEHPAEHARLWAEAVQFMLATKAAGRPWRLRDIREARRREREAQELADLELEEARLEGRANRADLQPAARR